MCIRGNRSRGGFFNAKKSSSNSRARWWPLEDSGLQRREVARAIAASKSVISASARNGFTIADFVAMFALHTFRACRTRRANPRELISTSWIFAMLLTTDAYRICTVRRVQSSRAAADSPPLDLLRQQRQRADELTSRLAQRRKRASIAPPLHTAHMRMIL